jgi:hypothetical protein
MHFMFFGTAKSGQTVKLLLPRYSIKMVFPFNRVIKFEDLAYNPQYADCDFSIPVATIELNAEEDAKQREKVEKLFQMGDTLLQQYSEIKTIDTGDLSAYQEQLYLTISPAHVETYRQETK